MDQSKLQCLSLTFLNSLKDTAPDYPSILRTISDCLPTTVQTIQLDFGRFSDYLLSEDYWPYWKAVDSALTASNFKDFQFFGLRWKIRSFPQNEECQDPVEGVKQQLATLDRNGAFKNALPGLYSRNLLWCGEWLSRRFVMVCAEDWQSRPPRTRVRYEQF